MRYLLIVFCLLSVPAFSQRSVSIAFTNNHTAYPFQSFKRLFKAEIHPGVQLGYGFNWKSKAKHDWYQNFTAGYFYHQFVQHAIPLYTQFGYRYKMKKRWQATASLGAGYLHSIPDAAVLELNGDGEYKNAKGLGRGQVMFQFALGPEYKFVIKDRPTSIFVNYQQMLQAPFINSYVPLLPYNSISIGLRTDLKTPRKK